MGADWVHSCWWRSVPPTAKGGMEACFDVYIRVSVRVAHKIGVCTSAATAPKSIDGISPRMALDSSKGFVIKGCGQPTHHSPGQTHANSIVGKLLV